jgi:hypothetical protein
MNSPTVVADSQRDLMTAALMTELEEPWFAEPAPSSRVRPSSQPPPFVHVGEFLGDPEVDAWLR